MQFLLFFLLLFSSGCARQHLVKVHGDSLTFYYRDAQAKEIIFASSQDNYQYHHATRGPKNIWQVTVPLQNEFTYFYIVDGVVILPECPDTVLDDFGSKNCLYSNTM